VTVAPLVSRNVAHDGALRAVAPDLATRWRVPGFPSSIDYGAVAVTPGGYVVAASGRELSAYDRFGTARWTTDLHGDGWFSRPAVGPSGVLYVVDTKWILHAVRPPDAKNAKAPGKRTEIQVGPDGGSLPHGD